MSSASKRAARRELQAAKTLGTTRVHRQRFQRAPDMAPVRLANGLVLSPECKTRKRLPYLLSEALKQARDYLPDAVPLAIVSQKGGRAIACCWLDDFARIAGIQPANPPVQTVLPLAPSRLRGAL